MNNLTRNTELRAFIASLVYAEQDDELSYKDKLTIISLYQHDPKSIDTMCTDFEEEHATYIVKLLNRKSTFHDNNFLIDEMYRNIRNEVEDIIDQESALKLEEHDDYYKCVNA